MNPYSLYGILSAICLSLPVLVIIFFRLYRHVSLIALALYYTLTLIHCITANNIPDTPDFQNPLDVAYVYVEIPLMLTSLLFFCPSAEKKRLLRRVTIAFIVFELLAALYYRFASVASMVILAPGILLVAVIAGALFVQQVSFTFTHAKNYGRVLMLGTVFYSYCCYLFVFYTYYSGQQSSINTVYTIYFISSIMAAVLMAAGLVLMRHRIKELQELKTVRKELKIIFEK